MNKNPAEIWETVITIFPYCTVKMKDNINVYIFSIYL